MSFPASLTLVTVTIQLDVLPSGGGAGTVQFISPRTVPLQGTSLVQPIDTTVEIGADGAGTIQLPAVDATGWSPAGWAYTVIGRTAHGSWRGTLQLLHTDTTVALHERLQIDGTATPGVSYLLLSQRGVAGGVAGLDDDGDVIDAAGAKVTGGEGGGAAPGSTVVSETTFGQTATAGTGTAYARATHSHGTPALPSASDVGADASGTAAAAVTAHVEASDPHTEYALETSLGDAALLDVGTTAGTVAAGDDSRLSDARTPTAHALSHADGGTDEVALDGSQIASGTVALARLPTGTSSSTVALGNAPAGAVSTHVGLSDPHTQYALEESLGGAALLDVGTGAGSVAAGDDSRITGAAQKASNLSDLANAGTARTNLGLGGAAVLDVGTGSGDVAAGDAPAAAVSTHEAASDPHPQYAVIMLDTGGTYAAADDAVIYVGDTEPTSPADGSVWIPAS